MQPVWHFVNGVPQVGPLTIGPNVVTSTVPGQFTALGVGVSNATANSIVAAGAITAGVASSFVIDGRSYLASPADGTFNLVNNGTTAGVGLDFATDAIFKVRTRAQSAYATVDALAYRVSGVAGASGTFANVTVVNGIVTSGT